jgi:hypothetical protein
MVVTTSIFPYASLVFGSSVMASAISAINGIQRCVICKKNTEETGEPTVKLTAKGSDTINQTSDSRNDSIHSITGDLVHIG